MLQRAIDVAMLVTLVVLVAVLVKLVIVIE